MINFSENQKYHTFISNQRWLTIGILKYTGSFWLLLFSVINIYSQDSIALFLIGNISDDPSAALYKNIENSLIKNHGETKYLIGTGDYVSAQNTQWDGNVHLNQIQKFSNLAGKTFLLSGDRDWKDSGVGGLKKMKELDKFFQKNLSMTKGLEFDEGCPGPVKEELTDYCLLILINSQWFMHPHEKPVSTDNDCDLFTEEDFWEGLEEMIEDASEKRIIIASHHNIYGHGDFSGEKFYKQRWTLPVIGNFIADYRKNVGRPKDFAFDAYAEFREKMKNLLANYKNIIYLSGHEHTSEVIRKNGNIYVNSGAMGENVEAVSAADQIYRSEKEETYKIVVSEDKDVKISLVTEFNERDQLQIPWEIEKPAINSKYNPPTDSGLYVAGPEYMAEGFKKFMMGEHYRKEWTTPIHAPKLWLDSIKGGLEPYAKGGGLQTVSLKLMSRTGRKYTFRSINKNPEKALDEQIGETIYRHLVKDLISTQHPYGSLVASSLLDQSNILHASPELYYLPDQEALGDFREEFSGTLGTLEIRPDSKALEFLNGISDVVSTHFMYRKLINKDDHIVDKMAYANARVFDMWVGDWDRHQDNWKWAEFKKEGITIYRPIPRDRDHVFSQWEGIIPTLADWVVPNAEHFGFTFGNIKHLNWKARHLDRFVGNELTLEDWKNAVLYLQENIDSIDIEFAINEMPKEVASISGKEIKQKLISRMKDLPNAVERHFRIISNEVNIYGSNKKDKFEIRSLQNGGLEVNIFDGKHNTYNRVFDPKYTNRIFLYGLGKKDEFLLSFAYDAAIKIKIIGGKGADVISDLVPETKKDVKVYDFNLEDELIGPKLQRKRGHKDPEFNVYEFEFPSILPFLGIKSTSGNGLGIQFTMEYKKNIFNKPDYGRITDLDLTFFPGLKAYLVDINHKYRYFWGKQNFRANLILSSYYSDYPFFYGLGNNTSRDHRLFKNDFYRIDYNTIKAKMGLSKSFWQQSEISYYGLLEYNHVKPLDDQVTLLSLSEENYFGLGQVLNYGLGTELKIDMRNSKLFTKHGSLFKMSVDAFNNNHSFFTKIHGHLAKYATYDILGPTTFILAGGIYHTIGEAPFYMQSSLGSNTNLRGYFRNRYVDRSAFYYNTELRFHLGTMRTVLAPIRFGTFLFHDSGKVFNGDFTLKEGMHSAYGLGLYFAPLRDDYSFTVSWAKSEDRDNYLRLDFGWVL